MNALDQLDAGHHASGVRSVLAVACAAVGVLLAIPTDGLSLAGAAGLATAAVGLAGATVDFATVDVSGGTVDSVLSSTIHAVGKVRRQRNQQGRLVVSYLTKVRDQLGPKDIAAPAPNPVTKLENRYKNAPASETIHALQGPDGFYPTAG
jgi:hypothetical protein